jgi:farnesyl diphosphate synthase
MLTTKEKALSPFLIGCQQRIQQKIAETLPNITQPPTALNQAMRYAVLNGGKRLRPLLVYATGTMLNVPLDQLDRAAIAVELIHCYSLVHDDLPAMDNDDLRRGQPTCHKAFNEATAILVGDALQSLAFSTLCNANMIKILADASGASGMAGGQSLDLAAEGKTITLSELEQIHQLKTGAIISACVTMAATAAGHHSEKQIHSLQTFSQHIGLAFQIQDDILDVEGETQALGKTTGADKKNNKATYTSILGLTEAKNHLKLHHDTAMSTLNHLPYDSSELVKLCQYIVQRAY